MFLFNLIMVALGFSGYILPLPSLIWGWAAWWTSRPRFEPPMWRHVAVLIGLALASVVGLSVLFVTAHISGMPETEERYTFAMKGAGLGFVASIFALLLSLMGKGPVRLPASLASFGLAALWFVSAFYY